MARAASVSALCPSVPLVFFQLDVLSSGPWKVTKLSHFPL